MKEKMPAVLLSFDIEEFDIPTEYGAEVRNEELYSVSRTGTERILDLLDAEPGAKATFFITGNFARQYPKLVCRMASSGHEIASHGMDHSAFETADLATSRALLEEISGKKVTGFRMARLAQVAKEEILAAGYRYDSSLNPVYLPGRYNHLNRPLGVYREPCGLYQVPVSAVPFVRFPLFWLSFKNLPLPCYFIGTWMALKATGFYSMYSHPWEYNEIACEPRWKIPAYVTRHAGMEQCRRLAKLLRFLKQNSEFLTISEYLDRTFPTNNAEGGK